MHIYASLGHNEVINGNHLASDDIKHLLTREREGWLRNMQVTVVNRTMWAKNKLEMCTYKTDGKA